jgi:hypothetical protein
MNEHENNTRATRAAKVLRAYESNSQEPIGSRVVDLITDLLHFARFYVDEGAESVLRMAKQHFDEEVAGNE